MSNKAEEEFENYFYEIFDKENYENENKPVNNFDDRFNWFIQDMEAIVKAAYIAGYNRNKEVESALQELANMGQEAGEYD
jgi:hypothetical protein